MKDLILNNWNIIRFLRLGIGVAIIVQAIIAADILFGLAGLLFAGMAVFNASCCGGGACATPPPGKKSGSKDVSYEEVV
ncbi:hypothetical protein SAMN05421813_11962 [Daejeonella rubra]|uniref:Uncharacterized protein n=1 Tax=Daejeonella rubra TaxID=990371 RepID=A0A1G9V7P7_9SPHI|nr:hypothetical protein [Daejeonella rubra]SDM68174.1 hypothetical protein SAMN05421813_11962 [Daejeonella rubra]